ncbi:WW domain-binding protein 1 [Bombina bombina]|uniref:WW domain-binding protein 1 n=1 Tax=Bombina bombina TaxID=8345 RepID=UPI00235A9703|nr:WW domain-binding protein 1 [Bombina bombina]
MRREELELGVRGSVYGREFCFGEDRKPYRCEIGYCCGDTECCTYYYELWWFWLAWTLIIMAGCCCAYRHRRIKLRNQQEQRQREISLMAYQGVAPSAAVEMWSNCKLPSYDEVTQEPPTPPPPYHEILREPATNVNSAPCSSNLDSALPEQRENLTETLGSSVVSEETVQAHTTAESLLHYDRNLEEKKGNASERRRHVTGDSGIELCEQEEEAVCLGEGTRRIQVWEQNRERLGLCRGESLGEELQPACIVEETGSAGKFDYKEEENNVIL